MAGFNLFVEGELYQNNDIALYTKGKEFAYSQLNLFHSGQYPTTEVLGLYASGDNINFQPLNLYTMSGTTIENELSIVVNGANVSNLGFNLVAKTFDPSDFSATENIPLFVKTTEPTQSKINSLELVAWNYPLPELTNVPSSMSLYVEAFQDLTSTDAKMNLFVQNYVPTTKQSTSLNLFIADDYSIKWDSDFPGVNITPDDEPYALIPATDPIRGVSLICYGNCDIGTCQDVSIVTHDTTWFDPICVDGGILRASDVYTNLDENVFGLDIPYSGHFYGIRKLSGLLPLQPYFVNIIGKTGSSIKIPAPKEMLNWGYITIDNEVGYEGVKLIGDDPYRENGRNAGDKYGSSISLTKDLLSVGSPHIDIDYNGYTLNDAGTVFVYRRENEPESITNTKASWLLEAELSLPSSIMRDYYVDTPKQQQDGIDIIERRWYLGQEGRNFGSDVKSVIVDNNNPWVHQADKEIIAVSAPNASWSRTFPDQGVQPNEILFFVFTDEFLPTIGQSTYRDILDVIQAKNLLYTYYSQPTISLSIKIVIFQPIDFDLQANIDFPEPKPSFIIKKPITRHRSERINSQEFLDIDDIIFAQIKETFDAIYPYDASKQHNNIPAVLGIYVDNSRSLGESAINPALQRFKDYYQEYSFASGVVDIFNNPASGAILSTTSLDENWIGQTSTLINYALDSGRLVSQNYLQLLTDPSTFGVFNTNLSEFNIPPSSGGCVYLFEKESGTWNLIQQIDSPNNDNTILPDRFGKSIDLSEDGNVLAIGSPYINQAISVYEYDPLEKDRLYNNVENWINYHVEKQTNDTYFVPIKNTIEDLKAANIDDNFSGIYAHIFINLLSSDQKYNYRTDKEFWENDIVQEYKRIFEYKYTDIPYTGTYLKLVEQFAPTSRMGYSIAINEFGTSVAVGCPTDSLDETDDTNTYYDPINSGQIVWPSYVNAGSVRVFDAITYKKHDTVLEYSKFGNRHLSIYGEYNTSAFDHFYQVYEDINKTFIRTDFDDFIIPDNAGLVFIICPEVDFSNIEVMNRIKRWLELGDRNLVLVGDDPIHELNGKFNKSNLIINTILNKLNSSMRLHPVADKNRALFSSDVCLDKTNVVQSTIPDGSISTYNNLLSNNGLISLGAADIRIHAPNLYDGYECDNTYIANNNACSPPLANNGDLRTSFTTSNGVRNWPTLFSETYGNTKYAPIPLYVAAQYKEPLTLNIPEIPPVSGLREFITYVESGVSPVFGSPVDINQIAFKWTEDENNFLSLNTNLGNNVNVNRFINPSYKMGVDPVLISKGSNGADIVRGEEELSPICHFAAEENIVDSTNKLILISTLASEGVDILYSGLGDRNINFYFNLAAKDQNGSAYIAQLNAWSEQSNFTTANPNSILELILNNTGNTVSTNVSLSQLITGHPSGNKYDVCWIANPKNIPSEQQLEKLRSWLQRGNKKIIVTYDNDLSAKSAEVLCDALNITMRPLYLPNKAKYANNVFDISSEDGQFYTTQLRDYGTEHSFPVINPNNQRARFGFNQSRDSIEKLTLNTRDKQFIPILLNGGKSIASLNHGISDDKMLDIGFYYLKTGVAKVDFAVEPNTAYRIFFNTVRYSANEKEPLNIAISNCSSIPSFTFPVEPPVQSILNFSNDDTFDPIASGKIGSYNRLSHNLSELVKTSHVDVQTLKDVNHISIFIDGNNPRLTNNYTTMPSTLGLVAVSGCKININSAPVLTRVPYYDWVILYEGRPAHTTTINFPDPEPIQSNSDTYCPSGICADLFKNSYIADGPVLIAQEIYQHNIAKGINPSRITLISDANLIEGSCIFDGDNVREGAKQLLQGLYPDTEFPQDEKSRIFRKDNTTKILAPERSSPARLFSAIGNSGLMERFIPDNDLPTDSGTPLSNFRDYSSIPINRPFLEDADLNNTISAFRNSQVFFGSNSKIRYVVDGNTYEDNNIYGGLPSAFRIYGTDFLDLDTFPSGYPGDLFGYSIDYHRGKLIVGAPFAAYSGEYITPWSTVINETQTYEYPYGISASRNGGAGSVYIYENNGSGITPANKNTSWANVQKLRPKSIHIGQDLNDEILSQLNEYLGINDYTLDDLLKYSTVTDQFGYNVAIYSDILAVGAPGHDYSIRPVGVSIATSGAFEFKDFNYEFDIKPKVSIDFGDPNVLAAVDLISGVMNNGAVYTFENKITNRRTQQQSWVMVEKLIPEGYNSRLQQGYDEVLDVVVSGTENEHFGENIALYRSNRLDADYTIAIGSPHHKFATSGNHISNDLENAGAVYIFDSMLRSTPSYTADKSAHIKANVFGLLQHKVPLHITNNNLDTYYYNQGVIYSTNKGEIYIEASGQDNNLEGFAVHRPYISAVYGRPYSVDDKHTNNFILYLNSVTGTESNAISLFCDVYDNAYVYNNMNLRIDSIHDVASGSISLFIDSPSGIAWEEDIILHTSGTDITSTSLNTFTAGY